MHSEFDVYYEIKIRNSHCRVLMVVIKLLLRSNCFITVVTFVA